MRSLARLGWLARMMAVTAMGSALLTFAAGSPALAGGPPPPAPGVGYGPPAQVPAPGGFFQAVISQQVCPAGAVIGPVQVGDLRATLTVPRGAFPFCVQVTLTAPNVAAIGNAGFVCFRAIGGVGVIVQRNGSSFPGPFSKPLSLHLAAASITHTSMVVQFNGSRFVAVPATVTAGSATVKLNRSPADLAVLARVCPGKGAVPGATKAGTGKPLLGEGLLAGMLVLAGAGVVAWAWRRPRRRPEHLEL